MKSIKNTCVLLLGIFAATLSSAGQNFGLSVGERCPDFFVPKIVDYEKPTAHRSDFKTPLLLLEFCTPGCHACFQTVPVLDSLQKLFPGQVSVLLVTSRTAAELERVKKHVDIRRAYPLPYAVEDTTLARLFPALTTPHMVWLDGGGTVKAITTFEYVTAPNIRAALAKEPLNWPQKKEVIGFDFNQPLLTGNELLSPQPQSLTYQTVTANLEGVNGRKKIVDSANGYRRLLLVNFSLIELYKNTLTFHKGTAQAKRTLWEGVDSGRYFYNPATGYAAEWEKKNLFCYESRLPLSVSLEEQYTQMRLDLNRQFGLDAHIEKRKVRCWFLVRTTQKEAWPKKEGKDYPPFVWRVGTLVAHLDYQPDFPPVIDATGLPELTPVELKDGTGSKEAINASLERYGLRLIEGEKELEYFVMTEKRKA